VISNNGYYNVSTTIDKPVWKGVGARWGGGWQRGGEPAGQWDACCSGGTWVDSK
jgi:hypothetical protein